MAVMIVGGIASFLLTSEKPLYGNNEAYILEVIRSDESLGPSEINILEVKDIGKQRIVSVLSTGKPSVVQFRKSPKGNYKRVGTESYENGETLAYFTVNMLEENTDGPKILFIANEFNEVAMIRMTVNEETVENMMPAKENVVRWVDLPEAEEGSYQIDTFSDEKGNSINVWWLFDVRKWISSIES